MERRFFEDKIDLAVLAAQQGISLVREFDELLGDFWPQDENADQFISICTNVVS